VTTSITISLTAMLLWHTYLAVSAQTTIEFYFNRWQKSQEAKRGNTTWRQPYDRGYFRNFCDFYNVPNTPLALFLWCLPSLNGSAGMHIAIIIIIIIIVIAFVGDLLMFTC
jgi:hypothetical protein